MSMSMSMLLILSPIFTQLMANADVYCWQHATNFRILKTFHIFQTFSIIILVAVVRVACENDDGKELPLDMLNLTDETATQLLGNNEIDRLWTTEALIVRQGYAAETHRVITSDDYVLTLHRLPQPGHRPVLLVHGLYGSAMDFVIMGRNISLAYALWNRRYDVWLANCRGSKDSQQHLRYTRDDLIFWNFSFHNIGLYDLPAMIDYIRNCTSFHDLLYVGYSQGATAFLALASQRPEYAEKILMAQLLAPLYTFHDIKLDKGYLEFIAKFLRQTTSRQIKEFMPRGFLREMKCFQNKFLEFSCLQMIFQIVGQDLEQFDKSKIKLLLNQMPSGGSVKQLRHYFQIYNSRVFQQYNYGFEGNYDKYAAPLPPFYNLSKIKVPIVLHYGQNDFLATEYDTKELAKQLTQLKGLFAVPHNDFNHLDFIWAKALYDLLNVKILKVFESFNKIE